MVAAEAREFAGVIARTGGRRLCLPVQFGWRAEFGGARVDMVADGPGAKLAGRAVDCWINDGTRPDAVVSVGLCGALSPGLKISEVVTGNAILDLEAERIYECSLPSASRSVTSGRVVSTARVAVTAAEKRSLFERDAIAVEMEAAGVARRASELRVPVYCIRSVSDTAEDDLVLDFNAYRTIEGRFSRSRIAMAAVAKPFTRVPALMRFDRDCRTAANSLGEFLVDCRW